MRAQFIEGKDGEEQRLRGVEVNLTYMAKGQPGKATIVADQGVYAPTQQKAVFQGHVHVTTEDGMDLKTDQLIYRGDHNSVKSDTHVEFKRKDLSGTAHGFTYDSETGRLELLEGREPQDPGRRQPGHPHQVRERGGDPGGRADEVPGWRRGHAGQRPAEVAAAGRELLGRGPGHPSRPGPRRRRTCGRAGPPRCRA